MIDLNRLLPKLLRTQGGNPELAAKLAWSRAAGPGMRGHAVATRLEGKALIISVADAIWQKQLEHMSAELLFRTNNLLGRKLVESLVFQINPAAARAGAPRDRTGTAARGTAAAPAELLFAARSIADEELRARFLRAAENCIDRRDALSRDEN